MVGVVNFGSTKDGTGEGQRMTSMLITALGHPVRREILRMIHGSDGPMSAIRISKIVEGTQNRISYHLGVLCKLGALSLHSERPARGAKEKFFASEVADHLGVLAVLADTEAEDVCVRR